MTQKIDFYTLVALIEYFSGLNIATEKEIDRLIELRVQGVITWDEYCKESGKIFEKMKDYLEYPGV